MAEWTKAADCKSVERGSSLVRIQLLSYHIVFFFSSPPTIVTAPLYRGTSVASTSRPPRVLRGIRLLSRRRLNYFFFFVQRASRQFWQYPLSFNQFINHSIRLGLFGGRTGTDIRQPRFIFKTLLFVFRLFFSKSSFSVPGVSLFVVRPSRFILEIFFYLIKHLRFSVFVFFQLRELFGFRKHKKKRSIKKKIKKKIKGWF